MSDNYKKYLETYSGKELLEKHNLSEDGTWNIFGEDPNCDLGGSHSTPFLVTLGGKLEDVIRVAVNLPNFWTWGGGGMIELTKVIKTEPMKKKLFTT